MKYHLDSGETHIFLVIRLPQFDHYPVKMNCFPYFFSLKKWITLCLSSSRKSFKCHEIKKKMNMKSSRLNREVTRQYESEGTWQNREEFFFGLKKKKNRIEGDLGTSSMRLCGPVLSITVFCGCPHICQQCRSPPKAWPRALTKLFFVPWLALSL